MGETVSYPFSNSARPVRCTEVAGIGEVCRGIDPGGKLIAYLPPYCSAGQKAHKQFGDERSAWDWLRRKRDERMREAS